MNELHLFEFSSFFEDPKDINKMIICTKINITEGVPSTRWGHSSAAANGKLYVLGGRNEQDIIDLHEFDLDKLKWKAIDIMQPLPKARRRHSCLLVSGALVMFGGFDGNFYNDLNILDLTKPHKQIIQIQPSSIDKDYFNLVNNQEHADIVFVLDDGLHSKVYAHKSLVLFRTIEIELQNDQLDAGYSISILLKYNKVPDFID